MRRVASQITTGNGSDLGYPTSDGTSEVGELIAQNASASSGDPSFGTRALNTFKFGSKIITIPIELLQDTSIDIVKMIQTRMRDRIGRAQNAYFTTGTGTAQPFGLFSAAGTGKVGTTGQTTTVIYDDLVDLVDSLDAAYLDVPASDPEMPGIALGWMFSQTMRRTVRKIKDTAGRPIWTPSYDEGMKAATPDMLLGYPVNINNDIAAPAANAKTIAFGNLHCYTIRDAMEVVMYRFDDSVYASKGQVGFLAWSRAGGNLMDLNSVKLYQHSAT
jgi:HK97 family phage major capsid protein